jgi:hypothetical protein
MNFGPISSFLDQCEMALTTNQAEAGGKSKSYSTKGWPFLISWRDGTSSCVPLRAIKDLNSVEVTEYAIANQSLYEPAFSWWVPHVIRKKDHIIFKVKSKKYWDCTH